MIHEHERVVLLVDLPEHQLMAGDVGVVVHSYSTGKAYEVEFFTLDGQTLDVVTIAANAVIFSFRGGPSLSAALS